MKKLVLLICLYFVLTPVTSKAGFEVRHATDESRRSEIVINGVITQGDYDEFFKILESMYKNKELQLLQIYLESDGGDVFEAMKIGELIRRLTLKTSTSPNGFCKGACFLIYVAGIDKNSFSTPTFDIELTPEDEKNKSSLGLHRPQFDPANFTSLSSAEAEKKYELLAERVKRYLQLMDVPEKIIKQYFSTPADQVYFIQYGESLIELTGKVASFEKWLDSKCGSYTQDEYLNAGMLKFEKRADLSHDEKEFVNNINKIVSCRDHTWNEEIYRIADEVFK